MMDLSGSRHAGLVNERRRFLAALGLFLLWVAALGVLAVVSGRRPESTPTTVEPR